MTATVASALVACADDKPGAVADDGSVTVTHVFGETRIPAPPTRVVSAGFTEQDDLLAVGVVPIAVTDWFGGEPFGVWPWARGRLGPAQPAVLSLDNGIDVPAIAALRPDLIVATNAGLDAETYARLSQIAPTVAQSGPAFFEPWKDRATVIGQAVYRADEMAALISGVEQRFTAAAADNPQFAGKKAMLLRGVFDRGSAHTTPPGWRTEFLTQMGFTVPDVAEFVPLDQLAAVLEGADVLIWATESDAEQAALLGDPVIAAVPPDRHVFTGKELAGAIAFASPLSYPFVADALPPLLSRAVG